MRVLTADDVTVPVTEVVGGLIETLTPELGLPLVMAASPETPPVTRPIVPETATDGVVCVCAPVVFVVHVLPLVPPQRVLPPPLL